MEEFKGIFYLTTYKDQLSEIMEGEQAFMLPVSIHKPEVECCIVIEYALDGYISKRYGVEATAVTRESLISDTQAVYADEGSEALESLRDEMIPVYIDNKVHDIDIDDIEELECNMDC